MVLITMMVALTFGSVWLEWKLGNAIPALKPIFRNRLLSLVFSIALSFLVGMMFGAAGVIVFISALLSTWITDSMWKHQEKIHGAIANYELKKAEVGLWYAENNETIKRNATDTWNGIRLTLKVIMFPFKVLGRIIRITKQCTQSIKRFINK